MMYPKKPITPTLCFVMDINTPTHSNDFRQLPRPIGSIAYVERGRGKYETPDGSFDITEGDILYIPIGGMYISHWSISPRLLAFQFDMPISQTYYPVQRLDGYQGASEDFAIIKEACKAGDTYTKLNGSYFEHYEHFYRVCGRVMSRLVTFERPGLDGRIVEAVEYIDAHLTEPFSIDELASAVGISPSYLFSRFRAGMGISPIEYKHRKLISEAERLFAEFPDISIEDAALKLGFSSDAYFRRTFKAITGEAPSSFRKRGQEL